MGPINEQLSAFWAVLSPDSGLAVSHVGADLIELLHEASDGVGDVLCDVLVHERSVAWGVRETAKPAGRGTNSEIPLLHRPQPLGSVYGPG